MRSVGLVSLAGLGLVALWWAAPGSEGAPPARKAYGLEKRVPWTTSKVIGSPEPPPPYRTEPAFPKLPKFDEPLDLTYAPGTNRLFVAERWGRIYSFVNHKDVARADLAQELQGKESNRRLTRPGLYALTI